jgi:hypothetical protein
VALSGRLSEYSLAEIFRFIDEGCKTGLLSIIHLQGLGGDGANQSHVWCQQGRVVAHTTSLKGRELTELFVSQGHFSEKLATKLRQQSRSMMRKCLGNQLESRGIINAEQLDRVFLTQVLRPVRQLFQIQDASFFFDEKLLPAKSEMTGLSISCAEISLRGLRSLEDWEHLQSKLPAPEYTLRKVQSGLPNYQLSSQETAIWQMANGQRTINEIARENHLSTSIAQYVAFRLTAIGILQEVTHDCAMTDDTQPEAAKLTVSRNFLSNLVGFLKK